MKTKEITGYPSIDKPWLKYYSQEISYIAGTFEDNGVEEGDIVTVCMINSPETIYLIFALSI